MALLTLTACETDSRNNVPESIVNIAQSVQLFLTDELAKAV